MRKMNSDQPTQPSTTNKDDSTFPSHCLVYLFSSLWAQSTSNPFPSSSSSTVSSCPVSVSVVRVEKSLALAYIDVDALKADDLQVRIVGGYYPAAVTSGCVYDRKGEKLKSND